MGMEAACKALNAPNNASCANACLLEEDPPRPASIVFMDKNHALYPFFSIVDFR
jgi:hypothetical protein